MTREHKSETILVIEDEADIRIFASRVLELEGYRVLQAENGNEGLRLVKEGQVSLVLLDLRLPRCDGWVVLQQMKADPSLSAIPIIVFTASAGIPHRERAFNMGAVDYLVKPLSSSDLSKAVARVLSRGKS